MKLRMIAVAAAVLLAGLANAAEDFHGKPYPLDTCVVSGQKLGEMGDPVQMVVEGRQVLLCCAGCQKKFEADPASYMKKIDDAIVEQQSAIYPLDTCMISGQKLGEMGDPVTKVYNNQLVEFCCPACVKKVDADPATYLKKIDDAIIQKQMADYPFDRCVVSGDELTEKGKPVDITVGGRLVRLCCPSCIAMISENPAKYLHMIETGKMDAPKDDDEG